MAASVLVVCTGNICRSPMAEVVLRAALPAEIAVSSAGVRGLAGEPMDARAEAALATAGFSSPPDWLARELTAPMVAAADLVLTATREHRAAVATLLPRAVTRCFTLRELALVVEALPSTDWGADPALRLEALAQAAGAWRGSVVAGAGLQPSELDIPDPFGRGQQSFDATLALVRAALSPLVELLLGRSGLIAAEADAAGR